MNPEGKKSFKAILLAVHSHRMEDEKNGWSNTLEKLCTQKAEMGEESGWRVFCIIKEESEEEKKNESYSTAFPRPSNLIIDVESKKTNKTPLFDKGIKWCDDKIGNISSKKSLSNNKHK